MPPPQALVAVLVFLALQLCVIAATDNNRGFDHRAHAVAGGPYEVASTNADGSAMVTLNGDLSHSHYFNQQTGATGRIVKYQWFVKNVQICGRMKCTVKFQVGNTGLVLRVVDNTGDAAMVSTYVNIYKGAKPGVRVWFYPNVGWIPNGRPKNMPASYSQTPGIINLNGAKSVPSFILRNKFSIRVLANIEFYKEGMYSFRLGCGGASCTFWIGNKQILTGFDKDILSKPSFFPSGTRTLEIVYRRQQARGPAPKLVLSWKSPGSGSWSLVPGRYLTHNPATYAPVVHSVKPTQAAVGSVITLTGSSFTNIISVKLGEQVCVGPTAKNQFSMTCVVPGGSGQKKISVVTGSGRSNAVDFVITSGGKGEIEGERSGSGPVGYYQPIKFSKGFLRSKGEVWKQPQLTAITLGPDGKYYIGSLNGVVHVVTTDLGSTITNYCKSPKVGKSRSILGLAFNPAENKHLRLYVSTSVLYWGVKKLLPFEKGWHNGEIIAMQKTKTECIARVSTVISGLPVSNHDHSVNGLSFDNSGNLLISVGGNTNAGVSTKGDPLGGVPDTPLSGAVLTAPILKKGFNGKIRYSQYADPGVARKVSGNVFVYAAGLRNSFSNLAHSNGHLYALNNGANAQFGAVSTGCNKQTGGMREPDTLLKLRRNGFHGYANRNRGRFDARQCVHRSPVRNVGRYDRHIATFESSTDGLVEYSANTFGAQMRGDILATKFAVSGSGTVFRVQLNGQGNVKSKFELERHSGLSAALSPTGALVMPRVYQGSVAVLLPVERNPGRLVVTSVNPFRGPKRGGGKITVTGWNLQPPLTVTVGGKGCKNVGEFKKGRSFTCIVPRGSGRAAVVVSRFGKSSKSYGFEYVYLNV